MWSYLARWCGFLVIGISLLAVFYRLALLCPPDRRPSSHLHREGAALQGHIQAFLV